MRTRSLLALPVVLAACSGGGTTPAADPAAAPMAALSVTPVNQAAPVDFCLTLLHNNDGESRLLPAVGNKAGFGGIAHFVTLVRRLRAEGDAWRAPAGALDCQGAPPARRGTLLLNAGDNFLAGSEFNASLNGPVMYDALALDQLNYHAFALGNHEFDFAPVVTRRFIDGFTRGRGPFVSANLDMSAEPSLAPLAAAGRIARRTVVLHKGLRWGIVGVTTPALRSISSPGAVVIDPNTVASVQREIDALQADGVTRIILIGHLQNLPEDRALIRQLRGVDVAISGGGSEILANPSNTLIPGDVPIGAYPELVRDADGRDVALVTADGNYLYVGRLVVGFDAAGNVVQVHQGSGPVRVANGSQPDAVPADPVVQSQVVAPVQAYIAGLATNVVATSEVGLDGRRAQIRARQTGLGSLVADAHLWQARRLAAQFSLPRAQVAIQNGGGIRNDNILPASVPGSITELNTQQILAFTTNFVAVAPSVPRARFKDVVENMVARVANLDGRFGQVAGFRFTWDASRQARTFQPAPNNCVVINPGDRVRDITLDDGTKIVENGVVVPGPDLVLASIDFSLRGGDCYPTADLPFTTIGVGYQQALLNYLRAPVAEGGLGGVVRAAQYPDNGGGRITRVN